VYCNIFHTPPNKNTTRREYIIRAGWKEYV
jgi:hypothetical protein